VAHAASKAAVRTAREDLISCIKLEGSGAGPNGAPRSGFTVERLCRDITVTLYDVYYVKS
jgi:hypothetical protein